MSKRRPFGTVRKLASGRWQARYRTGTGQRLGAPETFATKTEATRWLAMVEADQARGLWIDPSAGKVTLAAYSHTWLEGKVRISPRTREMYALQLRLHILPTIKDEVPALGRAQLGQLTPEWVRAWYAAGAAMRSPSVAAKAYVRLRQVLRQAVDDDRIPKNPCRIDGGGVERHAEQRFATLVELYELAAAVPDRYRALVLAAGFWG